MRLKRKILKFFIILLSIFLASLVAFIKAKNKTRVQDEEREAEELQEQADMDILMSKKHR